MDLLFGTFASKSLLIVRVFLGVIFFAHGAQKVFGWFGGPGLRGTIAYFRQALGVPPPLSVLAALTELLGGVGMIVGLLVRPADEFPDTACSRSDLAAATRPRASGGAPDTDRLRARGILLPRVARCIRARR